MRFRKMGGGKTPERSGGVSVYPVEEGEEAVVVSWVRALMLGEEEAQIAARCKPATLLKEEEGLLSANFDWVRPTLGRARRSTR